jgi:hypothetical protein
MFEINTDERVECPKCGADNPQKAMSLFSSLRNFIKWLGKSNCGANTGFS